jgi:uncharacterized membrane protein YphA (DoxX/SURF4 family)
MKKLLNQYIRFVKKHVQDVALLGVRAILVVTFVGPAMMKLKNIDATAQWFKYLGIPLPIFSTYLVVTAELLGVGLLAIGFATELISLPLIIVMIVAVLTVHMSYGWLAIAPSENSEIAERLDAAKGILQEYGNYNWLTEKGNFVVLNNGMEFPAIYIVLLLILLAFGPGKLSLSYLIKKLRK